MKIAIIASESPFANLERGGIALGTRCLYHGLRKCGHDVQVFSPSGRRFKELKFSLIPLKRLHKFDIVHIFGPTPFLSDMSLIIRKEPIVYAHIAEVTWISNELSSIYNRIHKRLAFLKAKAITVLSEDYRNTFFKGKDNVYIVRWPSKINNPNTYLQENNKGHNFTVLFVGQLRPFKGIDLLIEAAKLNPAYDFIIVGNGWEKNRLMKMAENLKNITFKQAISDETLQQLYKQSHVICLPSKNTTEAWGMVLVEGATFGCVPIASSLVGVRQNVRELGGETFLVNNVHSLSKKLRYVEKNYSMMIERVQKNARKYNEENNMKTFSKSYEEIYNNVLR